MTAGLLRGRSQEARTAIRAAMREETARYAKGDGFELPMPAVLASASKP